MLSLPRLALLVACTSFVACASGPEPRSGGDDSAETKRKKKKRKKKKKSSVFAKKQVRDDEVTITDDPVEREEDQEEVAARPKKKKAKDDDPEERERERDRAERAARQRERDEREAREREERERQARQREEREEREREEREEREREKVAKAKKKKKKARVVAAKAKRKPKAEEDVPEIEMDSEPEEEVEDEPRSDDDDSDVIEMTGLDEDPLAEPRVAAIPVPGVDDEEPEDEPEEEVALPPGAWPMQINDRPLVLAKDKIAAHAGLRVSKLTLPGATPDVTTSTTSQFLMLGGTYGISDKAEVGFDYALGISPGTVKGPFTLHGAYRAVTKPKLEIAVAAGLAIDFAQITNAMMMTTTQTSYSLQLGAWARYRVNRKVSLFSGVPATPASPATLSKLSFALPPLPYQLALGLNNSGTVALDLPAGVGYQAKPNVYAFAMLNLAHLRIANTANAFLFKDFIPFTLGGFYTRKLLDVGIVFADDLKQGSDYLRLDLLVRYSIK